MAIHDEQVTRVGTDVEDAQTHAPKLRHSALSEHESDPGVRAETRTVQNAAMRLDHVSFAAGPDGLASTAQRIGGLLGVEFADGGVHPRFGTRNMILPLADHTYMEIVEVLDHPASDKAPFGQAVRARSAEGGGWLGWVVAVDDISVVETRIGREAVPGHRHRPDGTELNWKQLGVVGLMSDAAVAVLRAMGERSQPAPQHRRRRFLLPGLP